MKTWKKFDIAGRVVILIAVAWQLTALGTFVSARQRGDILYIMENQAYTALMIKRLVGIGSPSETANAVNDAYNRITLFSEWDKNVWNKYIDFSTAVFLIAFLLGSGLSIAGRVLELRAT